jgi:DNA (cytosine-5)-methyltransferase 1
MINPTVVSLFSGTGGLDLGFRSAGFDVSLAIDSDPAAVKAYNWNFGHKARLVDVRSIEFIRALNETGNCDVLLGGFPCQGFSKAGPKRIDDDRNSLYFAMIDAMRILRPSIFVAENVDGLSQNFNGEILKKIVEDCEAEGYKVDWKIVDAAWFGVPQHRRRIVIVGIREDLVSSVDFRWPDAEHASVSRNGERNLAESYPSWLPASVLKEPVTLRDAIHDATGLADHILDGPVPSKAKAILAQIGPGQKLCNARHDASSVRTWDIPEAFGSTTAREREILEVIARNRRHRKYGSIPNGNPLALDVIQELLGTPLDIEELRSLAQRKYLKQINDKWDISGGMFASGAFKRPDIDSPSPTVLTSFHNARFMAHPYEDRPFTVREVARIQTFPDDFQFLESGIATADAYRLIGNAVPPKLAQTVAKAVLLALENEFQADNGYALNRVAI